MPMMKPTIKHVDETGSDDYTELKVNTEIKESVSKSSESLNVPETNLTA